MMGAAERLLYEVGYAGATTRAVAEAAGVNHGLVRSITASARWKNFSARPSSAS